jgi:hypothetical protein
MVSRRRSAVALVGVLLAATLSVIAGSVTPASAEAGPALVTQTLARNTVAFPFEGKMLLTRDLVMRAGESRRVLGRIVAVLSDPSLNGLEEQAGLVCRNASGAQAGISAWSNITLLPGAAQGVSASLLFTAPAAGQYQCSLEVYVNSTGAVLTALQGQTWLAVSAADEVGSHYWSNPPCDSAGILPSCTYLGPSDHYAGQRYLFYDDGTPPYVWTAASTATMASVTANVELTTCGHTGSCGGRWGESDGTSVVSRLELVQLDAAGRFCHVNPSPAQTSFIGNVPHHFNIEYQLPDVPILTTCGSRNFKVRILMRWVSGNPVKIDGARPDPQAETDAIIVNSYFGTSTSPVPQLLGLDQNGAQNALSTARLIVGTVSSVLDPAAPGTVVGQNPAVGTVLPEHSRVDLTVSLGAATVPDVMYGKQAIAIGRIVGAGLRVGRIFTADACVDPGTVQSQGLAPGSVVLPGTAVDITVSICTRGGPQ